jgi:hypothetical protein
MVDLDAYKHGNAAMFICWLVFMPLGGDRSQKFTVTRIPKVGLRPTFTLIAHQRLNTGTHSLYARARLQWLGRWRQLMSATKLFNKDRNDENPQQLFARITTMLVDAYTTSPRRLTDIEREAIALHRREPHFWFCPEPTVFVNMWNKLSVHHGA